MVLAHDISKGNRTQDVKITQNITFETMLLAPNTSKGLKAAGFYKPSPIQLYGIPIGKCGFDLLLEAKSGTGKSAVFSIIALELLDLQKGLQVVILTPTREIAAQLCDVLKQIGSSYQDLRVEVVMGGLPFQEDIEKFKKPVHIVVGSSGRLKHLIQNKHIDTRAVRLLVLDEADKLMEKCFQADIKFIHATLPKQKQVIMSSATYSETARSFINNYVQNANHVCPDSDSILLGIEQKVTLVKYNSNIVRHTQDRFKELLQILAKIQFKQCLVFCNYQARVSEVHKLLKKDKWPSEQLYGQQEQVDRLDALKTLQQYKCRILVSTDLAARGIDVSNIDLVINFEPPYEWQTYLHRIGRAGRFGLYGLAVTILSEGKEQQKFKDMFKSMDLSINMHYLWSDKNFNEDNSITPPERHNSPTDCPTPTVSHEINHEEMWEMLSTKTNDVNVIESFENLCQSKENFEIPNVETFSDLMLSLQNYHCQNNEEDYLFKQMDITKKISMRQLSTQKSIEKEGASLEINKEIIVSKMKTRYPDEIDKTHCKEFVDKSIDFPKTGEELRQSTSGTAPDSQDNSYKQNVSESETENIPIENELYSQDLLRSKLPPIFSSKKNKFNNTKWKNIKPVPSNVPDVNFNDHVKTSKKDLISMPPKKNYAEVSRNNHDFKNTCDLNKASYTYRKPKACYSNREKAVNYYGKINNSNSKVHRANVTHTCNCSKAKDEKIRTHSTHSRKLVSETEIRQKMYVEWYNRLKMRSRWLEQIIYINEMSKL